MAIDEVVQSPKQKQYGFAIQSEFGVGVADDAAFYEIDNPPFEINRDIKELVVEGAHGSRFQNDTDLVVHNRNAMPSFTVETFVKKEEAPFFFAALFQNMVEAGTTPYGKTYTLLSGQPDFQADAGYYFTWIERDPVSGAYSTKAIDCILKAATFTLAGDEPLKVSMEWIGKAIPIIDSNPTGTWTRTPPDNLFYMSDIKACTINFGGGVISHHLSALEMAISREVLGVGQDGAGGFQTYALTAMTNTFKMGVIKDSDFVTGQANQSAGTPVDLRIGWGNSTPGTDDGDLDFAIHGKLNGPDGLVKEHNDPMTVVYSGKITENAAGSIVPITTILADAVDADWV
jgi:hypothetical protein